MKKRIAITGGIGSGKSTVCDIIRAQNFPVFSCDSIYKELLNDTEYIEAVRTAFPQVVITQRIDTCKLAKIVFSDETQRKKLNDLAHSRIMTKLFACMNDCDTDFVFAEVPLLFEGNYASKFDKVIVVTRERKKRVQAVLLRDGCTQEEAIMRIQAQFDYDGENAKKLFQQDNVVIIENNEGMEALLLQVKNALVKL